MPYIDEKYIYDAINEWRGNNDMYGYTQNAEDELVRKIDRLPRVDGRHVMTCDTCRANKVCNHRKYGFENCGNYIPLDVGGEK